MEAPHDLDDPVAQQGLTPVADVSEQQIVAGLIEQAIETTKIDLSDRSPDYLFSGEALRAAQIAAVCRVQGKYEGHGAVATERRRLASSQRERLRSLRGVE